MKVKHLYNFQVWDALKKGRDVKMIDYADTSIRRLDRLTVSELAKLMKKSKDNEEMYAFYELVDEIVDENEEKGGEDNE